ncbi:MAG: TraB/GumN family protein [Alphaproteobacteria bacterium]|nr:TraB/GumN family protein [Alphaproteobacteria bacterium]
MSLRLALSALGALLLAGCSDQPAPASQPESQPILWELASAEGEIEGWLFGTIHALPDGVEWRSALLDGALAEADVLAVEVASLDDGVALGELFTRLAFDDPPGPLAARVDPALADQYQALLTRAKVRRSHFDAMETWAAALTLAQVAQQAKSENGVDRALIRDFGTREIVEFEGAETQLRIFDDLPEKEQRDLLNAVIGETEDYERDIGRMARMWQAGDAEQLSALTGEGILADPELYEALLAGRNRAWAAQLENLLSAEARPFVAVGAAHMFGADGLPALMEARGYSVRRIQ